MRDEEILYQLQALTDQLGIELLEREGEFTGGIYRLRDHKVFLINSSLSASQAVRIFCRELAPCDQGAYRFTAQPGAYIRRKKRTWLKSGSELLAPSL